MTVHDDESRKEKATKKNRKVVPIADRRCVGDCQIGDVIKFASGGVAVVTAWLNNGLMGRWIDADGNEGELTELDHSQPIERIRGDR